MALLCARTRACGFLQIMTVHFVRTVRSKGMKRDKGREVARDAHVVLDHDHRLQLGVRRQVVVELFWRHRFALVDSVLQRDIPAVQGSIFVVVLFFLAINLLIDVLYGVIDPRIRYA